MTNFDLLQYIGGVDDQYIMDSRKKPRKKPVWPTALAAVLTLVILAGGSTYFIRQGSDSVTAGNETLETSLAAGEPVEESGDTAPETAPAEGAPATTEEPQKATDYNVTLLASAQYPSSIATDDYEAASTNWTENQVSEDTSYALNAFSYKTAAAVLQDADTSGCYSPLSLYQTLSVLASGAEGNTRDQILNLLGISDLQTLSQESGKLYRVNYKDNDVNVLKIANSLWLDDESSNGATMEYNPDWLQSAAKDYYADIYAADFGSAETAQAMGSWIAEKTGGMLHPEFDFNQDAIMAIVNTLWYKTQWASQFQQEDTTQDTFTLSSGDTVTCDFMHTINISGSYVQGDGYLKSSLTLNTGKMIFVLPDEDQNIEDFLTEEKLWEIFENGNYESGEVHWSVPKFETEVTYDLTDTLQNLGITDAFDLTAADFSPIGISSDPLYLGSVEQGTHISINEDGVEAAAYSMAEMLAEAAEPEEEPKIIEMNLNRPFLYLITANDGSTLFIGVVRDPLK